MMKGMVEALEENHLFTLRGVSVCWKDWIVFYINFFTAQSSTHIHDFLSNCEHLSASQLIKCTAGRSHCIDVVDKKDSDTQQPN